MATSSRDLRRKIKSIRGTAKITSAMQLVAASKMSRAVRRATESRPYTDRMRALVENLSGAVDPASRPLFEARSGQNYLVLLVTSNRGLAGPLNTQLFREYLSWQQGAAKGANLKVVAVGAQGRNWLLRYSRESLLADFAAPDAVPNFVDATPISQLLIDEFLSGRVDRVYLVYNRFVSTLRQEPSVVQYLPFVAPEIGQGKSETEDFIFEPGRDQILENLVPRVLRATLYQTLLETHASEQSARMLAMKNATDNARDLIDDLTLTYNSYRQAAITGELLDIAAGAAALEG